MSSFPPVHPGALSHLQPHRGAIILTLGILSLVICAILGIFAWVMANNDLRLMNAGQMDPSGRGITQAGKICGMIGTILMCVGLGFAVLYLVFVIVIFGLLAAGAAAGAGGGPVGP
ncbi:MAG: hypothetical protein KF699_03715 [Phycisphaeraceae bacterium]|nr:hypothetical protein [Phycisphaeraceae bacterium]MBX3405615.1 hypothetical protein [Phycisphaeraceae bacterium]